MSPNRFPPASPVPRLAEAVRARNMETAEKTFAVLAGRSADEAFNDLLLAVQDNTEVHRTVLPYRAWDLLSLIGPEQAHTLLRQSVRYCVKSEQEGNHTPEVDKPRVLLPRLLDEHHLAGRHGLPPGGGWLGRSHEPDDLRGHSRTSRRGRRRRPGGRDSALRDRRGHHAGRQSACAPRCRPQAREAQPNKPAGSVHGDSIGVHACDSANAWRNMARVTSPRNTVACLILGGYQVAYDRVNRGGDFLHWSPRPIGTDLEAIKETQPDTLLAQLDSAIRAQDQARASQSLRRSARSVSRIVRSSTCFWATR